MSSEPQHPAVDLVELSDRLGEALERIEIDPFTPWALGDFVDAGEIAAAHLGGVDGILANIHATAAARLIENRTQRLGLARELPAIEEPPVPFDSPAARAGAEAVRTVLHGGTIDLDFDSAEDFASALCGIAFLLSAVSAASEPRGGLYRS